MSHRATIIATMLLSLLPAVRTAPAAVAASGDTLIVFLGSDDEFPTADLRSRLDEYRALAEGLGVELELRTLAGGAPEEIVITPLVVFQNHWGRSVYQGRYDNLDRVRNFVRTARVIPQSSERLTRTDALVRAVGRARVCTPIKLTALAGDVPEGFDPARFERDARAALAAGMDEFALAPTVALGRGDRLFYLDVHPYAGDGLMYLSCEIYSQFNCHTPIYSGLDDPVIGFREDRELLFGDAGRLFQAEVARLMSAPPSRDAFTPVPRDVPVVSWAALDLDLPPTPAHAAGITLHSVTLPRAWVVEGGDASSVLFRFAPPLEAYAGEAKEVSGELDLGNGDLRGANGVFRVRVSSITMGEPLLDKDLRTEQYFDAEAHPVSTFTLSSMDTETDRLRLGEQAVVIMRGRFELKGVSMPTDVRTSIEPILDAEARPRLLMTAQWSLRIADAFGLTGPDGPMPARDTVEFTCHFTLRPANAGPPPEETRP